MVAFYNALLYDLTPAQAMLGGGVPLPVGTSNGSG
jgi:hypothetical protein